jgi:tetratricopeptide (TPR) repeat protein/TolB-like protein
LTAKDNTVRLAIFPLEYLGPAPDQEVSHIKDYLAPWIGVKLHERFNRVIITDDRTMEKLVTSDLNFAEIGELLQVDYLLSGTIRIERKTVDMSLKLYNVRLNSSTAGISSNCGFDDLFDTEVIKITDWLGRELMLPLSTAGLAAVLPVPAAMEYFMRGKEAERKYRDTQESQYLLNAEQFYLAAVKIQPDYALYSWHLGSLYEQRYVATNEEIDQQKMFQYFRKAYYLDDNSAETNLGMGWASFYEQDNDSAYQYYLKAYELDPNSFEVNYNIGGFFRSLGLYEKAIRYYDRALSLNPGEVAVLPEESTFELRISCLIDLGRFQKAFDEILAAQDVLPDNVRIRFLKARLYISMGRYTEAETELGEIEKRGESGPKLSFYRSLLFAGYGEREKALIPLQDGYPAPALYIVTQIYCALGMKNEALQTIKDGIETGLETIQTYMFPYQYLINHPNHDLLRQEPEYQEIVAEQKSVYDNMVERYRGL